MAKELMEAKIKLLEAQVEYLECKLSSVEKNSIIKIESGGLPSVLEAAMIEIFANSNRPIAEGETHGN